MTSPPVPRRLAIPGIGALLLAACQGNEAGSPRAGQQASGEDGGGIGGTGIRRAGLPGPGDEGGIGGTGIFGTVTALGSLLVNGLGVETSAATVIETLAGRGGRIDPGDTVAIEAVRLGGGRLVARRVAVFHPLIGPLQAVEGEAGAPRLAVLGTRLWLPPDAAIRDLAGAPARLVPGAPVAVSGLWRGQEVVATGLTLLDAPPPQATVRGLVRRSEPRPRIGGTRIAEQALRAPLPAGSFATVAGDPAPDGDLLARTAVLEPLAVFSGEVGALSVEGFLAPDEDGPGVHLSGFGLPLDPSGPVASPIGERRLFLGQLGTRFRVVDSLALPMAAEARRAALAAGEPAIRRWLGASAGG